MRPPARIASSALAAAIAIAGLGSLGSADAKAVDQVFPVPASGVLDVRGHGWGHGHGMSQYGARGAARAGLTWQQILAFYYPGTVLRGGPDEVRVLVSADTSQDVVVRAVNGLSVRDLSTGATYALPDKGATRWRLNPDGARNAVAWHDGKWHRWKALPGDAEFFATGKKLTLILPSGSRTYRGSLRAAAPSKGSSTRDTVNVVSMDDYLRGVVPAEMPVSWEKAALRAQAVAARTYAAWSRRARASSSWQICDTTSCQVYSGAAGEDARADAAIDATSDRILRYDGRPAFTQFSSSSGGWTSAGSVPYLVSKQDPYEAGSDNPYTDWAVKLTAATIQRAYPSIGTLKQVRVTSREGGGDWDGRVLSLTLDGSTSDVTVSGDTFRSKFALRSTFFTFGASPILTRWHAIGGSASVVGDPEGDERAIPGGLAQDFAKGTIYWSSQHGAWELYGPTRRRYRHLGESAHALGLPVRATFVTNKGQRSRFEHGSIRWIRATGKTRVVIA